MRFKAHHSCVIVSPTLLVVLCSDIKIVGQAVVISAISLTTLKKLKFRRGASITLVLKNDENKEFLTPQVRRPKDVGRRGGVLSRGWGLGASLDGDGVRPCFVRLLRLLSSL